MLCRINRWTRIVVLSVVALSAGVIPPTAPARMPAPADAAPDAISRIEVRLRKLHLVRPDLIHYPIHYDVYC